MTDNNCAVLYGKHDIRLETRDSPQPGPGEVQVAVDSVGLCGSDLAWWIHGSIAHFKLVRPTIKGHEAAGIVSKIGEGVTDLKVGDRVAMEPGLPCHHCDLCRRGKYNLCPDVRFLNCPPHHGFLANYAVTQAQFCYKLPDNVSLEEGAMMEPLAVAVHACERAEVSLGDAVLVCGAGPIGLLNLLTAKAMGACAVCVTDISSDRLALAKKLGADYTVNVMGHTAKENAGLIRTAMGRAPVKTLECSGAEPSIQTAIYATATGGVIALVGQSTNNVNIPIVDAACREIDLRGVFRYCNNYPTAISMVASGSIDIKPLVTHRFPLEKTVDAFLKAESRDDNVVKVIVKCKE